MIPQLGASGTTFGTIFLFMTYIAYIFFGANLEDWSTFIFSIGSAIGAQSKANAVCARVHEDVFESTFFSIFVNRQCLDAALAIARFTKLHARCSRLHL